jgi:hypothetical protein
MLLAEITLMHVQVFFQSISSMAIAASVLFAALQFRQLRRAQHVANFTKLVELQMMLRRMRVDDPSLAAVYRHDVVGLETDKQIREYFFNLMQLSVFEIAWFSHREGQLTNDYYKSWLNRMAEIEKEDSFRRMMKNTSMKILHDDFHAFIMGHVLAADASPSATPQPGGASSGVQATTTPPRP